MARSQTVAAPAATKPHRPTRRVNQKAPVAVAEFNPDDHQDEIAEAAYHLWLERNTPVTPEQDWIRAVAIVRGRYAQEK
ncbi:MAG TPA: DUF2934 domain-containing protein [Acidobacteriaceae bacterium]